MRDDYQVPELLNIEYLEGKSVSSNSSEFSTSCLYETLCFALERLGWSTPPRTLFEYLHFVLIALSGNGCPLVSIGVHFMRSYGCFTRISLGFSHIDVE